MLTCRIPRDAAGECVLVGVSAEDVLDDHNSLLDHIVELGLDELQQHLRPFCYVSFLAASLPSVHFGLVKDVMTRPYGPRLSMMDPGLQHELVSC